VHVVQLLYGPPRNPFIYLLQPLEEARDLSDSSLEDPSSGDHDPSPDDVDLAVPSLEASSAMSLMVS
jgi:hypothetical protein